MDFAHVLYLYFSYGLISTHLNGLYRKSLLVCAILCQKLKSKISLDKISRIGEKRTPAQFCISEGISEFLRSVIILNGHWVTSDLIISKTLKDKQTIFHQTRANVIRCH